jgi:hypothetical protein
LKRIYPHYAADDAQNVKSRVLKFTEHNDRQDLKFGLIFKEFRDLSMANLYNPLYMYPNLEAAHFVGEVWGRFDEKKDYAPIKVKGIVYSEGHTNECFVLILKIESVFHKI